MASKTTDSPADRLVAYLSLWIARLALTTLAIAGMMTLLGGVDGMIRYPVAIISVAFLLKETL